MPRNPSPTPGAIFSRAYADSRRKGERGLVVEDRVNDVPVEGTREIQHVPVKGELFLFTTLDGSTTLSLAQVKLLWKDLGKWIASQQDGHDPDWRAASLTSSEVWAVRELIAVCGWICHPDEEHLTRGECKALYLIGKCEKNGVEERRCRRLLDILDLDGSTSAVIDERMKRYRKAR